MNATQLLIGLMLIGGSTLGYRHEILILRETGYGRTIRRWFGEDRADLAYRTILFLIAVAGGGLATGLVKPLRW